MATPWSENPLQRIVGLQALAALLVVGLGACAVSASVLRLQPVPGGVTLSEVGFEAQVELRNGGSAPFNGEYAGVCQVSLVVESADSPGRRWDQLSHYGGCKWFPSALTLEPGGSRSFSRSARIGEILGDSLPDGDYFVSVRVRITQPTDTTFFIPAGTVALAR